MAGLTDTRWNNVLDALVGTTALVAPTTPIKLALETAAGTATTPGTEAGGYTRPTVTFGAAATRQISNSGALSIAFSAGATLVAGALYDSAGTPVRIFWGPLASSRTVQAGDTLSVAVGALVLNGTN